jgi:hypothetical protein
MRMAINKITIIDFKSITVKVLDKEKDLNTYEPRAPRFSRKI